MSHHFGIVPVDEHNRRLLENVHPSDWENPEPQPFYNLVVVGAGPAGLISAITAASLGGKVALIERHLMGGDCLNVGCVPSKSLIRPARLAHEMKNAAAWGLSASEVGKEDFPRVMERMRRIRAKVSRSDLAKRYRDQGVDVFLGEARFTAPDTVLVGGAELYFRKAVIATGARAVRPDLPGLEECGYYTNETIFNLTRRPDHLLVVGGGPLGCELAQAFSRLGAQVTVIQRSGFLSREDPDASSLLADVFKREGLDIRLNSSVRKAESGDNGEKRLIIEHDGKEHTVRGDAILVGVGRAPNVEGMGLEAAGVEYDRRRGIVVDDRLRTSNRRIYAAGDCCMKWKFTHAAGAAARIVVRNALFFGRRKLSDLNMPWCTYTDPEITHVGLYEREAAEQNIATQSFRFDMPDNDRALIDGEAVGFVKVLAAKKKGRILGATIVASHAGEMIGEISTAMAAGMGLSELEEVIHPYPTQAEAIKRAAGLYRRTRLSPPVRKLFAKWLAWRR